jgi:hypothetical protein
MVGPIRSASSRWSLGRETVEYDDEEENGWEEEEEENEENEFDDEENAFDEDENEFDEEEDREGGVAHAQGMARHRRARRD